LLFPCLQNCNAFCAAVFPAFKVATHFVLLFSLPAKLQCRAVYRYQVHPTPACATDTSHSFCRQHSHAMGDGECKAAAGMGHRSPLHHCPATAPRGRSLLAGLQSDRPGPSEMCSFHAFVSCDFLSLFPSLIPVISCHQFLSLFPVISCRHFLSLFPLISCHCFLSLFPVISRHQCLSFFPVISCHQCLSLFPSIFLWFFLAWHAPLVCAAFVSCTIALREESHQSYRRHALLLSELFSCDRPIVQGIPDGCQHRLTNPAETKALPHEGASAFEILLSYLLFLTGVLWTSFLSVLTCDEW
jgi:hypothetical protein